MTACSKRCCCRTGNPLYKQLHLDRLTRGLQALAFPDCLATVAEQLDRAAFAVKELGWHWAVLKVCVTRGSGPRGYGPPTHPSPRVVIYATAIARDCASMREPAALSVASVRLATQPLLAGIKHLNRLEQVLAAAQATTQGVDESLLLDQSGNLNSVTAGNLFLVRKGQLLTPPLQDCGVEGTRRRLIIDKWAPSMGLAVSEEKLTVGDLESIEEVFYCNSLLGLRAVARIEQYTWDNHTISTALFQRYRSELP